MPALTYLLKGGTQVAVGIAQLLEHHLIAGSGLCMLTHGALKVRFGAHALLGWSKGAHNVAPP